YGRSYLRPLVALFYLALIGTLAFLSSDSLSLWQSLGLSAANTFNVFGFRKDFFEAAVIARLPAGSTCRRLSNHPRHHSPFPRRARRSQQIPHEMSRGNQALPCLYSPRRRGFELQHPRFRG